MRAHPAHIRHGLLACFLHLRTVEVTDDTVRMLLEVIRRIETQTEKHLRRELLQDVTRVAGKIQILFRVAEAVVEAPEGIIRDVLFPRVNEAIFRDLTAEAKASGPQYRIWAQYVMRQKFTRHYRRMLPLVLEHLTFRSENRFQPVIEALAVIKRYLGTKYQYFPEAVPVEGVVPPSWRDAVLEHQDGHIRIHRQSYELCVLRQLERALKCKEIWVEGAYAFRRSSQDLPVHWENADQRAAFANVAGEYGMAFRMPTDSELAAWGVTAGSFPIPRAAASPDQVLVAGTLAFDEALPGWVGSWRMRWRDVDYAWRIGGVNFDEAFRDIVRGVARVASGHGAPAAP